MRVFAGRASPCGIRAEQTIHAHVIFLTTFLCVARRLGWCGRSWGGSAGHDVLCIA